MTDPGPGDMPAPGLLRRLAAIVYDTFLILPLIMVAVAAVLALRVLLPGTAGGDAALPPLAVQITAAAVVLVFFTYFWCRNDQTLGMQAWRIRIESTRGGRVSPGQSLLRCLCAVASAACLGAGYWWCLIDRRRRCWHDRLSGTRLILLPRQTRR